MVGSHRIPVREFAAACKQKRQTVRNNNNDYVKGKRKKLKFTESAGKNSALHLRLCETEMSTVLSFFKENTHTFSGDKHKPVHLLMTKKECYMRYVAEYPKLLRAVNEADTTGSIYEEACENPNTRFRKSVAAAVHQETTEDHCVYQEYETRKAEEELKNQCDLEHNRTKRNKRERNKAVPFATRKKAVGKVAEPFDVTTFKPQPVSYQTFFDVLKLKKIRYTQKFHPHYCPTHRQGPVNIKLLELKVRESANNQLKIEKLTRERVDLHLSREKFQQKISESEALFADIDVQRQDLAKANEELESNQCALQHLAKQEAECSGKIAELQLKVKEYKDHLKQYEFARPYLKDIENRLKPGCCVVFRDFVNSTSQNGKVTDLVLVVVWKEGNQVKIRKIHNFCTEEHERSTDAAYVFDVFRFHLSASTEFAPFHKIYLSGDHGPHFTAKETFWHESQFKNLYGKDVHLIYLCSYHAFNRCDRAGYEYVTKDNDLQKSYQGPITAADYTDLMNAEQNPETIAYPFNVIDRNEANCPDNKKFVKKLHLKSMCEVRFLDLAGVILYRLVPGIGQWITLDMMRRADKDTVCVRCTSASLPRSWQSELELSTVEISKPLSCPVLACNEEFLSAAKVDVHLKEVHNLSVDHPLYDCNPPAVVQHGLTSCPLLEYVSKAALERAYVLPDYGRIDSKAVNLSKSTKQRRAANKVFCFRIL
jgi:hypothetical protein